MTIPGSKSKAAVIATASAAALATLLLVLVVALPTRRRGRSGSGRRSRGGSGRSGDPSDANATKPEKHEKVSSFDGSDESSSSSAAMRRQSAAVPQVSRGVTTSADCAGAGASDLLPSHLKREVMKERRFVSKMKQLSMKSPMYDNVKMLDPRGQLLCTISSKKGRWYVRKELADWTSDEHRDCIRLRFEPKARSNEGHMGTYVKSDKLNVCVCCGGAEYHMRHYVVPFAYRTLLPERYKSHMSHDVVILCPRCHVLCERSCHERMLDMEASHRPADSRPMYDVDSRLYHVRSCALALLRWKDRLPHSRRLEYDEIVRRHLKVDPGCSEPLDDQQLQRAIAVEYRVHNEEYVPGPALVVAAMAGNDVEISRFIRGWRKHFVRTMHPRYLPRGWSIDSPVVRGH